MWYEPAGLALREARRANMMLFAIPILTGERALSVMTRNGEG